jgi:hypothetical protein
MANQNRRITRDIKSATKKLKRGEIPYPPTRNQTSPLGEEQFWEYMKDHRKDVEVDIKRRSNDSSRRGRKRRLQLTQELASLDQLLNEQA